MRTTPLNGLLALGTSERDCQSWTPGRAQRRRDRAITRWLYTSSFVLQECLYRLARHAGLAQ
jgi:hypothetical protein